MDDNDNDADVDDVDVDVNDVDVVDDDVDVADIEQLFGNSVKIVSSQIISSHIIPTLMPELIPRVKI